MCQPFALFVYVYVCLRGILAKTKHHKSSWVRCWHNEIIYKKSKGEAKRKKGQEMQQKMMRATFNKTQKSKQMKLKQAHAGAFMSLPFSLSVFLCFILFAFAVN